MKVFISALAVVFLFFAGYLLYKIDSLREDISELENRVGTSAAAVIKLESSLDDQAESTSWKEMDSRLSLVEEKLRTPADEEDAHPEEALSKIAVHLATHDEEIAEMQKDLEVVRRTRGALDRTADRLLGTVDQEASSEEEAQRGGMERLMELGSLFRKRPEELTEEEKARRDDITNQLRRRQVEWSIQRFDRRLEVKLTEQQRVDLNQLLVDEQAALQEIRNQDLTAEDRSASRKEAQAQTDQRAAQILSTEQYESWKGYRSRSSRGGSFGRFR